MGWRNSSSTLAIVVFAAALAIGGAIAITDLVNRPKDPRLGKLCGPAAVWVAAGDWFRGYRVECRRIGYREQGAT